jgi:hypothetical protein
MNRKLSRQFLQNFLVIFLLTILDTVLAFMLLSFASGLIADSLVKNRYPASSLLQADYNLIDASGVVQNGGGVQVVDKEYRVVYSKGLDTIGKWKIENMYYKALCSPFLRLHKKGYKSFLLKL